MRRAQRVHIEDDMFPRELVGRPMSDMCVWCSMSSRRGPIPSQGSPPKVSANPSEPNLPPSPITSSPAPFRTTVSRAPKMSLSSSTARPLGCLKQALRQCRAERQQQQRTYAAAASEALYPSLQTRYPPPAKGFRPSIATKQNRTSLSCQR